MGLNFKRERPKVAGEYLYKYFNHFQTRLGRIAKGDWRKAQNPNLWYFNEKDKFEELRNMNGYFSELIPDIIEETCKQNNKK